MTTSATNIKLTDDTQSAANTDTIEFELIPGDGVFIEYHGGGGSCYQRWEDLREDIQERLEEVHTRMVREIGEVFSLMGSVAR